MGIGDITTAVSCHKCRFYQVTWDPGSPYGCLAHGFKSRKNPAFVVFESSGIPCQLFLPKASKGNAAAPAGRQRTGDC